MLRPRYAWIDIGFLLLFPVDIGDAKGISFPQKVVPGRFDFNQHLQIEPGRSVRRTGSSITAIVISLSASRTSATTAASDGSTESRRVLSAYAGCSHVSAASASNAIWNASDAADGLCAWYGVRRASPDADASTATTTLSAAPTASVLQ
jgi:hypothetical protein